MIYADYVYYIDTYCGSLVGREEFPRLAARASAYIDYYTFGQASSLSELTAVKAVKNACCALAEQFLTIEQCEQALKRRTERALEDAAGDGEIKSETVGAYSVTRQTGAETASAYLKLASEAKRSLSETARRYLIGTGLLYRGRRCSECMRRIP